MIVEVLNDMGNFILILIVVVLAFAHAYLLLCRNNTDGATIENFSKAIIFSYQIPMGDYQTDSFPDFQN